MRLDGGTRAGAQAEEEDAEEEPMPRQPTEPRVASFKWASRLGGLSSSDTETSVPSPQAGMLGSLGELSTIYRGTAGQHVGDLLGMSDAPQQLEHAGGGGALRDQDSGRRPMLVGVNGAIEVAGLKQEDPSRGPSCGPSEAGAATAQDSCSSSACMDAPPVSPPTSPFEKGAGASQPDLAHTDSSGRQLGSHAWRPSHRRDASAASRHSSGLAEMESITSWGSFRDSEQPADAQGRPGAIPEGQEEAASCSSEPQLNSDLLSGLEEGASAEADAGCVVPAASALSAPAMLRLSSDTGESHHSSISPAAISPAQSWQAGDERGLPQDPFAAQLSMHHESSSPVMRPVGCSGSSGAKTSLSTWEQEQIAKFASSGSSA